MGPPPYRQFSIKMINKSRLTKLSSSFGSSETKWGVRTICSEEEKVTRPPGAATRHNTVVGLDDYLPVALTSSKAA